MQRANLIHWYYHVFSSCVYGSPSRDYDGGGGGASFSSSLPLSPSPHCRAASFHACASSPCDASS